MFPILSLGPISIPVPEFIILLGFWLGTLTLERFSSRYLTNSSRLSSLPWFCLAAGLVGGRITYIANNPAAFQGNIISVISINPNLIDRSGGIIIAITAGYFYITKKQIPYWNALDAITPFIITLLISLNLANFASGDNFGSVTTLPWGIYIWSEVRHPLQLYLLLGDLITLFYIFMFRQKGYFWPGKSFLSFLILGSAMRLFLFAFQANTPLLGIGFRQNQVIAWVLLGLSLILNLIKSRESRMEVSSEFIR